MDSTSKGNEMERRVSMRNSVRMSVNGGDDDDMDFGAGMISDGFRPSEPTIASEPSLRSMPTTSTTADSSPATSAGTSVVDTVTNQSSASSRQSLSKNRSSIAKPPRPHDSFSLRHDGGMGPILESNRTRTSTMSTDSTPYIRPEAPYQGPSGPSHPYQMYPQNVRMRSLSVATSSTEPVSESSYAGPRGPTHPYTLYPQSTVPESSAVMASAIPVGFHGLPDQYQRRLGPDGEDMADMIGPDGHTEQLPPYTRYPEEAYARKARDVDSTSDVAPAPAASGATLAVTEVRSIPGAGGIGLATRNPEFESTDDLASPQSRHSSRSFTSTSDASQHEINTAAAGLSEKGKPLKKWQIWMRRRLWGIVPYWAICLTGVVLLLMGVILGSVIGTFIAKAHKKPIHKDGDAQQDTYPTVTVTYDATPIPTPTDLASLAVGTYGMPLMSSQVSSTCFNDTQLSQAWNCNLVISGMYLTISSTTVDSGTEYSVSINCNQSMTLANNVYSYGEQPPLIVNPLPLVLVNDTVEPNRGPAWFRMMPYNKTVILPEASLSVPTSSSKMIRDAFGAGPGGSDFKRKGVAQSGDKPWICSWPDTFLELFIYPQQNSSWNRVQSSSSSSSSSSATSTTTTRALYGGNGAVVPSSTWTQTATSSSPFGPVDTGDAYSPPPPPYPKVIKLEERRIDGAPQPQCTQVEIKGPGQPAQPVKDSNGNLVVINIVENEPAPPGNSNDKRSLNNHWHSNPLAYRDVSSAMSQCGCIWYLT